MATKIGSLLIQLGLDSGQFKSGLSVSERELRKSTKNFEKIGRSLQSFGAKMSIAVTAPMVALAKKSVDGFIEQERAMADVTAALKSMGNASGKTAAELSKTADALEMNSLFDAEVILKQVTAQLLTFGNVAGEQFDRAQKVAVDMATRLGREPREAAIQLGKALNDPVKGITALTRVGVQFTDAQQKQIKAMAAVGNVAGAQRLILSELEKEFGGAAKAAADATPWRQAQVAIGQAMDAIGQAILPIIKPAAEAIASLATAFAGLPVGMQKAIVAGAAIAAVFGPIIIVIGSIVSAAAPLLAVLGAIGGIAGTTGTAIGVLRVAFAAAGGAMSTFGAALLPLLANPVVLALAGLTAGALAGYEIWKHWDEIAPILRGLWSAAKEYIGTALRRVLEAVLNPIGAVKRAFFDLYDAVVGHSYIPDMVDGIAYHMKRLDQVLVAQADKATTAAAQKFRDLRDLLGRLFPGQQAFLEFSANRDLIRNSDLPDEQKWQALIRLADEYGQATAQIQSPFGPAPSFDSVGTLDQYVKQMGELNVAVPTLADKFEGLRKTGARAWDELTYQLRGFLLGAQSLGETIRNLVRNFADMALQAGFKALGASLGIPQFASGTSFAPGGPALVGEHGPEIVNLNRGDTVTTAADSRRAMQPAAITAHFHFPNVRDERTARVAGGQAARAFRRELNGPLGGR